MIYKYWDIDTIDQKHDGAFIIKTKDESLEALVRFDGCMHLWSEEKDERDMLHFDGGLQWFIEAMKELRYIAYSRLSDFMERKG